MNYFKDLSSSELKKIKGKTLKASWIISLSAPFATAAAFLLGQTSVLLADFLRRTTELLALFLNWYFFRKVEKGKDERYNYGYYKLEDISSLLVGSIMIFSFFIVLNNAIGQVKNPTPPGWLLPGLVISGIGFLVNGWFWQRNYFFDREQSSPIFSAQWRLYRVKTLIDISVFLTLIFNLRFQNQYLAVIIDLSGSLIVAVFLLLSGYQLINKSIRALVDRAPLDIAEIESKLEKFSHFYQEINEIRCRRAGGIIFIEVLVGFNQDKKISEINEMCRKMTDLLKDSYSGSKVDVFPVSS